MTTGSLLRVADLATGYHHKPVLDAVSLEVHSDETVALIGPNGSGKSTVLKAVAGLLAAWSGRIEWDHRDLERTGPAERVAAGISLVPQGNRVFAGMTVRENLNMGGFQVPRQQLEGRLDEVLGLFPELTSRLDDTAGLLSGGQQQMVAVGRALVARPRLLLLDEPSIGLSPDLTRRVLRRVREIQQARRLGVLVVEQKVREVLKVADRAYGLRLGKVALERPVSELREDQRALAELFI
jgi:branched-chain amino acid transport system ATP-binding protein